MSEINKNKKQSPLVTSVLSLDTHFSDLERLSARIEEMDLKSESDFNQVRLLMTRFTETAHAVSDEIVTLANLLNSSRERAESAAKTVAAKADQLQARQDDQDTKSTAFRALAEKVNVLNESLKELKKPEGETLTEEDRAKLSMRLSELDLQLQPLIDEALVLKKEAHSSKMKLLEQNADSLSQSLMAVRTKLSAFQQSGVIQ